MLEEHGISDTEDWEVAPDGLSEGDAGGHIAQNPLKPPLDQQELDRIFGEVLPESTSDDRDVDRRGSGGLDDWYRANRPPHHGG
ncbi:hypothetical protein EH165_03140 [Nakamurella antarctica]|uniref:Uncharacterized protein n=1 Tax=Nakamurella antarctica TaxID=1902245 RepID=A0A3G8ZKC6_9ACTN|nr:hypothetical protein [Nakamurella antarctica]AZI57305.1 hypothetical protein EH165_03140 [Nakamurella antarctica]